MDGRDADAYIRLMYVVDGIWLHDDEDYMRVMMQLRPKTVDYI